MRFLKLVIYCMFIILGCAFTFPSKSNYNANSWSIYLDDQVLLASWNKNKMGDLKSVESKKYASAKLLKVSHFLCGIALQETTSIITIKTDDEKTILRSSTAGEGMSFSGQMEMKDLIAAPLFKKNEPLKVYFTVKNKEGETIVNSLMGKLIFKA